MSTYKAVLANRPFLKYLSANAISRFADSLDVVAYSIMVYQLTGSAALMAALYAVNMLPNIILSVFAGTLVSYVSKRLVIFVCDYGRGITVVITASLFYFGLLEVWMVFVFTALNSTFESFRTPAAGTMIQSLVKEAEMTHSVSLLRTVSTMAEIIGYSAAALLISLVSITGALLVDGFAFIVCGTVILFIRNQEALLKVPTNLAGYLNDLAEGMKYFKKNKLVLQICLNATLLGVFLAPINALQVPYAEEVVGGGAIVVTIMAISFLICMLVGSALAPTVLGKLGLFKAFILGGVGAGVGYFCMALVTLFAALPSLQLVAVSLTIGLIGFSAPFMQIAMMSVFMREVEPVYMARVGAVFNTVGLVAVPIGAGISSILLGFISLQTLFMLCGAAFILLFSAQLLNPILRKMDASNPINA